MYPILYNKNETNFTHNGQGFLRDALNAYVEEELNGKCELTMTYPADGFNFDKLGEESILKVRANEVQDEQLFRVYNVVKKHVENQATVTAKHITNDFAGNFIERLEIKNANGTQAMSNVFSSLTLPTKFKGYSNVTAASSTTLERVQSFNAIAGIDGSLLDKWGGEIERDNFTIKLLQRRGRDNSARIAYKKNLKGLEVEVDTSTTITRVFPFATKSDNKGTSLITLKEKYVISDKEKNYAFVRVMPVDFSSDETVKDEATLRAASKNYFSGKKIDEPSLNMKVDFVPLWSQKAYKKYQNLERVAIGDTVNVYHPKFKMNITAKVVATKYDIITGKNEKVELGSIKSNFMDNLRNDLNEKVEELPSKEWSMDLVNQIANDIQGINGGSIYTYPPRRPHTTYYLDTDDINTAKHIMVMNYEGIAFSKNGVNGPWKTGWSIDGVFVADFIQTGTLKSGLVQVSFNGIADSINITGTALEALKNNIRLMALNKNGMEFFNGSGTQSLGTMGTAGKMALDGVAGYGTDYTGKAMFIDLGLASFLQISNKNGSGLQLTKEGWFNIVAKHSYGLTVYGNFAAGKDNNDIPIISTDSQGAFINGNLMVSGNKNAVVKIGDNHRVVYAYETAESYFGDIGSSITSEYKEAKIYIEKLFGKAVNTEVEYHVYITAYSDANYWVSERTATYFIVKSDVPNAKFGWELKAKRKGSEDLRLEEKNINSFYEEQSERSYVINKNLGGEYL